MLAARILRVLNYALLAVFLLAAAGVIWLFWRPTPKTSGEERAPVGAEVAIVRDETGVPHIRAKSFEDALFAQGFVTAQDRMWQMDVLRRLAGGELSEVIGKAALELDVKARKLRMRRIAELWQKNLPPQDRAGLAAYARGVNFYIESNRGKWAPEFVVMRYDPRPWTVTDSLLCGLQMVRTLSGKWEEDLLKGQMLATGDPAKVEILFPQRTGAEPYPGSNAWAIAGWRTTTGKPILANDPHLEWSLPSTWYMAHLQAPGLNVAGSTLPGVPGVIVGHNERIAWGITALQFDDQDLYIEDIDFKTGQYRFKGQSLQAAREDEWVAVKGDKPIHYTNLVTVHGPMFTSEGETQMSLKWGAAVPGDYGFPILDLNRAGNWVEFRAALARMRGPNINVMYADVDGNIGWQVVGRIPRRNGFLGDVPLDGQSGKEEWDGFIPFAELPSYYNPPEGYLVSANQNSFPPSTAYTVSGFFAAPQRALQIRDLLTAKPRWSSPEMLGIQTDIYSGILRNLAAAATAAAEKRGTKNPMAMEGAKLLKGWNGQMEMDAAAPMAASLLYQHVKRAIAERASPKDGARYSSFMAAGVVDELVRERPQGWFDDFDLMLSDALSEAMDEGKRMQGRDPAKWRYGRMNEVLLEHPVFGRVALIAPLFDIGPSPMGGSSTTVKQTTRKLGPSMRFTADLANWDNSLMNLTAGQSGHRLSGHYKDEWPAYYAGRGLKMQYSQVAAAATLTLMPR